MDRKVDNFWPEEQVKTQITCAGYTIADSLQIPISTIKGIFLMFYNIASCVKIDRFAGYCHRHAQRYPCDVGDRFNMEQTVFDG